jgi:hypothetical protein
LSTNSTSEQTTTTSSTLVTSSTSTTNSPTNTTISNVIIPAQPFSSEYAVNHTIYFSGGSKSNDAPNAIDIFEFLKVILAPEFYKLEYKNGTCPMNCLILYNATYRGFANPNEKIIGNLIERRANRSYLNASKVNAISTKSN